MLQLHSIVPRDYQACIAFCNRLRYVFVLILLTLCLSVTASQGPFAADSETTVPRKSLSTLYSQDIVLSSTHQRLYEFQYLQKNKGQLNLIIKNLDAARRSVARTVADAFLIRMEIILVPDAKALMQMVGDWAEHSTAVVISSTQQMIINCDAIQTQSSQVILQVLTHEMAHLYLSIRLKAPIPRWLNEGIAMRIAGDWNPHYHSTLAWAVLMHKTIPLRNLESSFPVEANYQQLAYCESYSVTDFIIRKQFAGSLPLFLSTISGTQGINNAQSYFQYDYRESIEYEWLKSNYGVKALVSAILSENTPWVFVLILTIIAWISILRRKRQQRRIWALETQIEQMRHDYESIAKEPTNEEIEEEVLRNLPPEKHSPTPPPIASFPMKPPVPPPPEPKDSE